MSKTRTNRFIASVESAWYPVSCPENLPDTYRHCEQCGDTIHYADTWASDYGLICDSCASAEMDRIGEIMLRRTGS